ncbi:MAG: TonB-dependent receptor [Verrucomicrobia bacterium]|nr:TonB-dependent receptor [Verrucomicrobiota bacterium]
MVPSRCWEHEEGGKHRLLFERDFGFLEAPRGRAQMRSCLTNNRRVPVRGGNFEPTTGFNDVRWRRLPVGATTRWTFAVALLLALVTLPEMQAEETSSSLTNYPGVTTYKSMSLSELMDQDVMSVTKTPEKLSKSPSAVQVITGEDIRRSGAMTIPDALRLAPNLGVQQINSYAWGVSARGFNAVFANKLLVMIDGRSVYTPLHAGVLWDAQNLVMEDIDRIEVVSGPGGTLWGANAVNGVINILTKSAKDTQGLYLSGAGGSFLDKFGAIRYGGQSGTNLFYRVYVQRFDYESTRTPAGNDGNNSWNMNSGGFRMDYYPSEINTLTLQGDFYSGTEYNGPAPLASTLDGQNVLGRWTRTFSEESDLTVQVYFDRTWRRDLPSTIIDELNTYDVDLQHRFALGSRNNVLWGAGYRLMQNRTPTTTAFVGFVPEERNMQLFSAFLQDEITLIEDRLKLTLGTKLEHNDFSGFELQPSARLAWTPTERQTIWGAVSRAVRSPSRIDVDYRIPKAAPYLIAGGPEFESEKLLAYELGYRIQPMEKLSLSLATFYNQYTDVYSVESANPPALFPFTIQNGTAGQSWGAELSGTYQVTEQWRLRGGYTYFHKDLWSQPGHNVSQAVLDSLGNDPKNQFVLQSMLDLPAHFQLDVTGRYVSSLPNPAIPAYVTADVRLAWHYKNVELALVGQNLVDNQHAEYNSPQETPRSIYGKITLRW